MTLPLFAVFDAYYDPLLKTEVKSYKEQEKLAKNFRSPDHPDGLGFINDNGKWRREMKHIRKNIEDYKAAKFGGRYKPGMKARFDEKVGDFVPLHGTRKRKLYSFG